MDYETIIVERKGAVGFITLNRPDQLNTFTTTLAEKLNNALDEMEKDSNVRVVVIKGAGRGFSASLGKKHCLEMLLTGDLIDAERVERIGLINKVVPAEKLEEEVLALANNLASKSPLALQMGKHAFYSMSDMEFNKAFEYVGEMMAELCVTEDAKKGVEAFLQKKGK